ncbi:hypothetical protein [Flagellimonas sp.]|uniref:hypothetical protein n=1 Tax=Flagellimonas sp. TaxID=2058762 RepID=UPI003F4A11C2
MSDKKKVHRKFIIEGILVLLIATTPLAFYFYKYLPTGTSELSLLGLKLTANGFEDTATAIYFYGTKLVPLVLLIVWFVTNKNWWYHAIIIPIAMYSFQLYGAIKTTEATDAIDENEILYILAVTMVITPVVYFIRVKLVDKHVHGIDLDAMDTELQILKEKEELRKEREKLEQRQQVLSKKV